MSFSNNRGADVILQKCYRNSRPVLVTAHGLGFGVYRDKVANVPEALKRFVPEGLVQMFDYPKLWEEIGYQVKDGVLAKGQHVVLERTEETSPKFLEQHSDLDDLVQFLCFESEAEQNKWLVEQIQHNLNHDELRHDDIVVIHTDPFTARHKTASIRSELFDVEVQTHLAGVDTDADVFFRTDTPSVTFTGIYRAKGNEAGMVYVINAQDCNSDFKNLASLRNRLFTAITRSKAWVRVIGYGSKMQNLVEEFYELKRRNFVLDFTYPDDEALEKLRIVHQDMSLEERRRLKQGEISVELLISALESGKLLLKDIDEESRIKLRRILGEDQ